MNSVNWQKLSEFMLAAFQDVDPNVRLQAVKILENYIKGESVGKANSQPVVVAGPMAGTSPGAPGRIASRWIHSVPVCILVNYVYLWYNSFYLMFLLHLYVAVGWFISIGMFGVHVYSLDASFS
jgi:hypothetical protein